MMDRANYIFVYLMKYSDDLNLRLSYIMLCLTNIK